MVIRLKFMFLFVLSLSLVSFSQQNLFQISNVVNTDRSKFEVFELAKVWFEGMAKTGKMNLIANSKDGFLAELILDYNPQKIPGGKIARGKFKCAIQLAVKDGRYKYVINHIEHIPRGSLRKKYSFGTLTTHKDCPDNIDIPFTTEPWKNRVWKDMKVTVEKDVVKIMNSLENSIVKKKKPTLILGDDW